MIRVFIAHSNVLFRQRLCFVLSEEQDMEVVGVADSGREVLMLLGNLLPDVAIIGSELPSRQGLDLVRLTKLSTPTVIVAVLGSDDSKEHIFEAIKAGAACYFPENIARVGLIDGIRRLSRGQYLMKESLVNSCWVAWRVFNEFQTLSLILKRREQPVAPLSFREAEIPKHNARGYRNKVIGHVPRTDKQTAKNQMLSAMRKLKANDRLLYAGEVDRLSAA